MGMECNWNGDLHRCANASGGESMGLEARKVTMGTERLRKSLWPTGLKQERKAWPRSATNWAIESSFAIIPTPFSIVRLSEDPFPFPVELPSTTAFHTQGFVLGQDDGVILEVAGADGEADLVEDAADELLRLRHQGPRRLPPVRRRRLLHLLHVEMGVASGGAVRGRGVRNGVEVSPVVVGKGGVSEGVPLVVPLGGGEAEEEAARAQRLQGHQRRLDGLRQERVRVHRHHHAAEGRPPRNPHSKTGEEWSLGIAGLRVVEEVRGTAHLVLDAPVLVEHLGHGYHLTGGVQCCLCFPSLYSQWRGKMSKVTNNSGD